MAAVVTATTEPSLARRCGSAGCTTLKKPAASSASWLARSAGETVERWRIGTCGPAACTSVCSPPYAEATESTTSAQSAAEVTSSRYAEAWTPHARAASTADDAAGSRDR